MKSSAGMDKSCPFCGAAIKSRCSVHVCPSCGIGIPHKEDVRKEGNQSNQSTAAGDSQAFHLVLVSLIAANVIVYLYLAAYYLFWK